MRSVAARARRQSYYKCVQDLYKTSKSYLAGRIADGLRVDLPGVVPPIEAFELEYQHIFDDEGEPDGYVYLRAKPTVIGLYAPSRFQDIERTLQARMSDAASTEGMRLREMRSIPTVHLALLFNFMLLPAWHHPH